MTRCTLDVLNPHKTPKPDFLRYFICTSARLQTSWEFRTLYISCMECKEGSTLIKLDRPQETFKCSIAANIWFYLRSNQATIQQRLSNVLGPHLNCHTLRAAVQHGTWSCALRSHQVILCKCLEQFWCLLVLPEAIFTGRASVCISQAFQTVLVTLQTTSLAWKERKCDVKITQTRTART